MLHRSPDGRDNDWGSRVVAATTIEGGCCAGLALWAALAPSDSAELDLRNRRFRFYAQASPSVRRRDKQYPGMPEALDARQNPADRIAGRGYGGWLRAGRFEVAATRPGFGPPKKATRTQPPNEQHSTQGVTSNHSPERAWLDPCGLTRFSPELQTGLKRMRPSLDPTGCHHMGRTISQVRLAHGVEVMLPHRHAAPGPSPYWQ